MKFGILYNIDYHPEVHGSNADYYAQILEQIELIEELGFDSAWFGEHHYAGYSFGAPAVIATAAASRTRRLRLGTGVSLIPLHHPLCLAEEYAMFDVLSQGRLEYGIGRGFLSYAYQLLNVDMSESMDRFREGTDLIVKAWTAREPFSFRGKFWQFDDYQFFPPPLQKPHPPIYASGTQTLDSFIYAGMRGFNLCTAFFAPDKEGLRAKIQVYRETLIKHGHDPVRRDVAGVFPMHCGETREESLREGGQCALNYFKFFEALYRRGTAAAPGFADKPIEFYDQNRLALIGEPDYLIERIQWAQEYYGSNYLLLEVAQGGATHESCLRSLRRFGKYVIPAFKTPQ